MWKKGIDLRLGLYVPMLSFAVNIGANYVFVFGKLGFPAMGAMGAALGTLCARIVELVVCFQAIQSTLSKGILRGGGDTKFLMVADVLFQWCASIPLGILAGLVWGLSPFWGLIALRIDYFIKSVWLIFRLKSGKWIHQAKRLE